MMTVCAFPGLAHSVLLVLLIHLGAAQYWTCLCADGEMGERSGKPAFSS